MEVGLYTQEVGHLVRMPNERGGLGLSGVKLLFVNEMLKHAGPKPQAGLSSGGAGEGAFHSMYIEQISRDVTKRISLCFY